MRVLLVSDFGLHHTPGGAQRSNQLIVDKGFERGHQVVPFHFDSDVNILQEHYDVVISSNLEAISSKYPDLVKSIITVPYHVRLEHDSNLYWNNEFRKVFWSSCKISFFLTKFHHEFFIESYGDFFPNVKIVPDPIDESFYDMGMDRSKIGYVGFMHPLKGTDNFIAYASENQDKDFVVAAWGSEEYESKMRQLSNVKFLGKINHDEMPKFYNSLDGLYYNPICNEPFCRAVGEALMCGTNIIGDSDRIGSLEMFKQDPDNFASSCVNAASNFWRIIENDFDSVSN